VFFIKKRIIGEALYIQKHRATIRQAAEVFKVSKSTVHKDMSERLFNLDKKLFLSVREILNNNLKTRHLRGGEETKRKYKLKSG